MTSGQGSVRERREAALHTTIASSTYLPRWVSLNPRRGLTVWSGKESGTGGNSREDWESLVTHTQCRREGDKGHTERGGTKEWQMGGMQISQSGSRS